MKAAHKLAIRYLIGDARKVHRAGRGARLDPATKTRINRAFHKAGLDGNGRFIKSQQGFSAAVEILQDFDVELDEVANSHPFNADSGRMNLSLAFTNPEDSFSPIPIVNASLTLTFYRRSEDNYEVLAYVA